MTYPHRIMSSLIYKPPTKRDVHLTMITLLTSLLTVFFFILKVSYLLSCPGDLVQPPLTDSVRVRVFSPPLFDSSRTDYHPIIIFRNFTTPSSFNGFVNISAGCSFVSIL